jgi:hypothetical protein
MDYPAGPASVELTPALAVFVRDCLISGEAVGYDGGPTCVKGLPPSGVGGGVSSA